MDLVPNHIVSTEGSAQIAKVIIIIEFSTDDRLPGGVLHDEKKSP
jgi:hypothetical protein